MGGSTGWRVSPLPPDWKRLRLAALRRDDFRCTWLRQDTEQRCSERKRLEVDHAGDRDDHALANLRTLCRYHHAKLTHAQSMSARTFAVKQRDAEPSAYAQRLARRLSER
ncbi:HNH endonuclease [Kitasatospora sp. NPDC003701]